MEIVSLNLGLPREIPWHGKTVLTGIFKTPVTHPVRVLEHHLEGDGQADLKVHGGEFKAVYAYAAEHYDFWRAHLNLPTLPFGSFGENLTIRDFPEQQIRLGDTFAIGTAVLQAVQPRMPCFKLGIRFNDPAIIEEFLESGRWGVYFRVLQTGTLSTGDKVTPLVQHSSGIPLMNLFEMQHDPHAHRDLVEKALRMDALPEGFRRSFHKKLGLNPS